jgi:hypothetical protein
LRRRGVARGDFELTQEDLQSAKRSGRFPLISVLCGGPVNYELNEEKMAIGPLRNVGTPGQKAATRALTKFCSEHGQTEHWISQLEEISKALEARDVTHLKGLISLIRRAGMGSFHDWFPRVVFPNENQEYVECLGHALYGYWREMMDSITESENT